MLKFSKTFSFHILIFAFAIDLEIPCSMIEFSDSFQFHILIFDYYYDDDIDVIR